MDEFAPRRRRRRLPRRVAAKVPSFLDGYSTSLTNGSALVAQQEAEVTRRWAAAFGPGTRVIICDDLRLEDP
ncbi:hypothetical protein KBY84_12740 [Cyanobium sp. N.Huapi 1H5]|uniref:hypothetical protein n=1 Tax=Cyanobium sp. N.Huapi 1H5 TaxID=2823719 RepID=UPI0020CDEEF8|nr:hypothetical protein [Cyanobium sp. N.Huapi 1H5]MCP9838361.1 hypothetical protein [Cyanobium sp. N.Huapi 1H5]